MPEATIDRSEAPFLADPVPAQEGLEWQELFNALWPELLDPGEHPVPDGTAPLRERERMALRLALDPARRAQGVRELGAAASAYAAAGDAGAAERCLLEAADVVRHTPGSSAAGLIGLRLAELYLEKGNLSVAREHCDWAFEALARLDAKPALAEAYRTFGALFRESGKPYLARTHLRSAAALAEEGHSAWLLAEILVDLGHTSLSLGDPGEAVRSIARAYRFFAGMPDTVPQATPRVCHLQDLLPLAAARWAQAAERDSFSKGHSARVCEVSEALARAYGLTGQELVEVRIAAALHDIGEQSLPDGLLAKPGPLSPAERALAREHPVIGAEILEQLALPAGVANAVRFHHERWDGGGYPAGLGGEAIPLAARIVAVAEIFDGRTRSRSYRNGLPRTAAWQLMQEQDAGRAVDPDVFDLLRGAVDLSGNN